VALNDGGRIIGWDYVYKWHEMATELEPSTCGQFMPHDISEIRVKVEAISLFRLGSGYYIEHPATLKVAMNRFSPSLV
jgi:hypothetical protein